MKLEDMILVTENRKGTETLFLIGLSDYMEMVLKACENNVAGIADAIKRLYETKEGAAEYSELYFAGNKSCQAAFCYSATQLRGFLLRAQDGKTKETGPVFDKSRCSAECLEVLKAYGIGIDGHSLFNSLHYETVEKEFKQGETIWNFNGVRYRVLEVLSERNLLLMSEKSGDLLVGVEVKYYKRCPKEGYSSSDSVIYGVEWGSGVYLGNKIGNICYEDIRSNYGVQKEQETLAQYRDRKKQEFCLYQNLMGCEVSYEMKEAARQSLDAVFGTEDYNVFCKLLNDGYYDGEFCGIREEKKKQEKSR